MSVSGFFGSLAAQFIQDLLFRRPVTIEVRRDSNGMQMKAQISPSGSQQQPQHNYGYPPPYYPWPGYAYGYPPGWRPPEAPAQQGGQQSQPPSSQAAQSPAPPAQNNRVRPFILPQEHRSR